MRSRARLFISKSFILRVKRFQAANQEQLHQLHTNAVWEFHPFAPKFVVNTN